MAKKIKRKKPATEIRQIFKTLKGRKQKFVNITIRSQKKTTNKQYKYRGGKFETYLKEARIPKGTKYYINYSKNQIIRNPREIDKLIKIVKETAKTRKKGKKKKVTKTKALKILRIIPKKAYTVPEPIESNKVVDLLRGKIFYEREHSITEFTTKQQDDRKMLEILSKGTKSINDAKKLLQNFDKIKLKLSYAAVIEGVNKETGETDQIATFTTIGKRPNEIAQILNELHLSPSDTYVDIYRDVIQLNKNKIDSEGIYFNKMSGIYKITDVRLVIKFYNNPQTTLRRRKR